MTPVVLISVDERGQASVETKCSPEQLMFLLQKICVDILTGQMKYTQTPIVPPSPRDIAALGNGGR